MKFRALFFVALACSSSPARAQQADERARGAARALAEDGVAALQNGDAVTAADKLERAYQIVRLPTVGLWSARALVKEGKLVSAAERYVDIIHWNGTATEARTQEQAKADAARERDELLPRIPNVTLIVDGANPNDVAVTLDGEPVLGALIGTSQPTDPKHHVLRGTRGIDVVEQQFDIAEGQQSTVTLKFGPPTAAPLPPVPAASQPTPVLSGNGDARKDHGSKWSKQRVIGAAVGGVGIVGGILSVVFTVEALSKKSNASPYCKGSACTSDTGVNFLNDAYKAGNVATVAGIGGVALIGTGAILFLTAPAAAPKSKVSVAPAYLVGGGAVVATGSF